MTHKRKEHSNSGSIPLYRDSNRQRNWDYQYRSWRPRSCKGCSKLQLLALSIFLAVCYYVLLYQSTVNVIQELHIRATQQEVFAYINNNNFPHHIENHMAKLHIVSYEPHERRFVKVKSVASLDVPYIGRHNFKHNILIDSHHRTINTHHAHLAGLVKVDTLWEVLEAESDSSSGCVMTATSELRGPILLLHYMEDYYKSYHERILLATKNKLQANINEDIPHILPLPPVNLPVKLPKQQLSDDILRKGLFKHGLD